MNRFALLAAAAIAIGLSQGASAADLAVKAPAQPPAPSWTGFYIGVHGGAAWQSAPDWSFAEQTLLLIGLPVTGGGPSLGAVGGIQGGYNWQFAPAWVLGIEGDISWASLADHRTSGPILVSGGGVLIGSSVAMSANTEWLSSVRGKLGWIGWNTLWYVTGGGAWVNTEFTATTQVLAQAAGPNIPNPYQSNTSFNTTQSGWVLGGGAEWQATTNILIRAEYLYYNLHNGVTASAPFSPPIVNTPPLPVYSWSNYNVQVARIAASYKF